MSVVSGKAPTTTAGPSRKKPLDNEMLDTNSIPGRDLHSALNGGWLGTRYTHWCVYFLSHTLSGGVRYIAY